MSRLKLSHGKSLREVGDALFKAGGLALPVGEPFDQATNEVKNAGREFKDLFDGPIDLDPTVLPEPPE